MTFYHQKDGTKEEKIIFEESKNKMDQFYNEYMNTYKTLNNSQRKTLWNKYLQVRKQVEIDFQPFGFIC